MFFNNAVDSGYFRAMGVPVVRGRALAAGDEAGDRAVVVNETFARRIFPGVDAVGQCVSLRTDADVCTRVVGVVRDVRFLGLTGDVPPLFYGLRPDTASDPAPLLVRVRPGASADEVRRAGAAVAAAVQAAEPRAAFVRAEPVGDVMLRGALAPYRLTAATFTAFGLLALAVAAVGLYGAVAYTVAQRTSEFGVRAALGAGARDLVRLVLGQGLRTVAVGAVIGAVGAVAAGRLLQGKLYGVDPLDPLTLAATGLVLAAAALLATWLPARRAARVDPAVALRAE
jgi:hypothetical protein